MSWMFAGCRKLVSIDLSKFNTNKVVDIDISNKILQKYDIPIIVHTDFNNGRFDNNIGLHEAVEKAELSPGRKKLRDKYNKKFFYM